MGEDRIDPSDRKAFATKIRVVRAVLGWSQTELGRRVSKTQRAIHKLEQGETAPRRSTTEALRAIWRQQNIKLKKLPDGGFTVSVSGQTPAAYGIHDLPRGRSLARRQTIGFPAAVEPIAPLAGAIAAFSYTLDLTHAPTDKAYWPRSFRMVLSHSLFVYGLRVAICVLVATALYFCFERNTQAVRRIFKTQDDRAFYGPSTGGRHLYISGG